MDSINNVSDLSLFNGAGFFIYKYNGDNCLAPAPSPSGLFPKAETNLVISQIASEIRISCALRLMPVGAEQGASAFLIAEKGIILWEREKITDYGNKIFKEEINHWNEEK